MKDIQTLCNNWFNKMGIQKAPEGVSSMDLSNFGQLMPIPVVEDLISLSRSQSQWIGNINQFRRKRATGVVPRVNVSGNVTEGVGKNDPTPVVKQIEDSTVDYSCKKFKSEYYIDFETWEEFANTAELPDFEAMMAQQFAIAWGNDQANIIMNSDTSLDGSTSMNRMLRMIDGVQKQLNASANIYDAQGKEWGQGIWATMQAYHPEQYRNDPGLGWIYNDIVEILWNSSLTNVNTTQRTRSALGDRALITEVKVPPLGKPQNIVNQISANQGQTPTAPTDVTDNTTTLTFRVNPIFPDATDFTGKNRRAKVTCKLTGESETCLVTRNGSSQNIITTVGLLKQTGTPSTTAADYEVTQYDETNIIYCNPKGITQVLCNQMRSFREYNKDYDRIEVTVYWRMDAIVPAPEIFTNFKRVAVPIPSDW